MSGVRSSFDSSNFTHIDPNVIHAHIAELEKLKSRLDVVKHSEIDSKIKELKSRLSQQTSKGHAHKVERLGLDEDPMEKLERASEECIAKMKDPHLSYEKKKEWFDSFQKLRSEENVKAAVSRILGQKFDNEEGEFLLKKIDSYFAQAKQLLDASNPYAKIPLPPEEYGSVAEGNIYAKAPPKALPEKPDRGLLIRKPFFHGRISQEDAEKLLRSADKNQGNALIRQSGNDGGYRLCVLADDGVCTHYLITNTMLDSFVLEGGALEDLLNKSLGVAIKGFLNK